MAALLTARSFLVRKQKFIFDTICDQGHASILQTMHALFPRAV